MASFQRSYSVRSRLVSLSKSNKIGTYACVQSFTEDIEDGFTPGREASKNENGFLGNRVDHSTKFLVVE
jgi:hypothetical protein